MKGPKACFQCLRMQEMASTISKFSGGACPWTPLVASLTALGRLARVQNSHSNQFLYPVVAAIVVVLSI